MSGGLTREEGVVIRANAGTAWIKTTKTGACSECSAKGSCHTLGGGKEMEVKAINEAGAAIGDRVVVGFETSSLLKASFLIYIFPVLGLIVGAAVGQEFAPMIGLNGSAASPLAGLLFFSLTFLIIRRKGNELAKQNQYRPKVIRIINASGVVPTPGSTLPNS
jgi:sigma-E factor negative regulatory protein RseC